MVVTRVFLSASQQGADPVRASPYGPGPTVADRIRVQVTQLRADPAGLGALGCGHGGVGVVDGLGEVSGEVVAFGETDQVQGVAAPCLRAAPVQGLPDFAGRGFGVRVRVPAGEVQEPSAGDSDELGVVEVGDPVRLICPVRCFGCGEDLACLAVACGRR